MVAEKRVWSGLQLVLVMALPTVVGGVNDSIDDSSVIFYCFVVTCSISFGLYKRNSLACKKSAAHCCFNKMENFVSTRFVKELLFFTLKLYQNVKRTNCSMHLK